MTAGGVRVAVDIGGTFTDIVVMSGDGILHESKISTTPDDPSRAVVAGLQALLAELGIPASQVEEVLHGTTVGSNTILQRSGARTGLITTRGFRDVLEIGRIRMPDMFDLTWDKPKPLVPRRHRLEVAERIAADGGIVEPLSEASVVAAGERLVAEGIQAVAICLINSYRNPAHEQRVEAILRQRFPAAAGDGLLRRAARAQGIRAHQHHGGERLSAERHARLPAQPRKRPALDRHRGADPRHHLQRRHAGGRHRLREAGVRGGLGPGRRRDRRGAPGCGAFGARPHRVRHGRHDGEGRHHRGWAAEHDVGIRVPRWHLDLEPLRQGRRLHAQGAGHRHRRGRRRRRLAGGHRQGRPAQGRPRIGRRRAGPRLLRPRQRAAHRDGRQCRARPHQSHARWRAAGSPSTGA